MLHCTHMHLASSLSRLTSPAAAAVAAAAAQNYSKQINVHIRIAVLYRILTRLRPSQLVHLNIPLLQLLLLASAGTSVGVSVDAACACVQLKEIDDYSIATTSFVDNLHGQS